MTTRKVDPNVLFIDENGEILEYEGSDAEMYARACTLLEALIQWRSTKTLLEPSLDIDQMMELVQELVDRKYDKNSIDEAIDIVHIWCSVMRAALPEIIRATS